jgi:serine/threonine protein phosphatase 1
MSSEQSIFATLRGDARVWAIAAIHGAADHLAALHQQIANQFQPGDQIVYLGNYFGHGHRIKATIDEILLFRRAVLAEPDADCGDVVFLRGAQEEMWQKLLQLQFAPNPVEVLHWMAAQGVDATIEAYGSTVDEAILAARDGILSLTRWTGQLRQAIRSYDGHGTLMSVLRHAAFTDTGSLLFVHAGIDPARPLSAQSDSFWWGGSGFASMEAPFSDYRRIVRGFDRKHGGCQETPFTLSIDAGCGFGGPLMAAQFDAGGALAQVLST